MEAKRHSNKAAASRADDQKGTLLKYFLVWKALLLAAACASPGPGYDTSTQTFVENDGQATASAPGQAIEHFVSRLTRWDGIYFAYNSAHGHTNEQNWAFSWTLAKITSFFSRVLFASLPISPVVKTALTGILISNLSHLVAVLAIYQISISIVPAPHLLRRRIALVAACLHIMSPAGIFLSAPYGESTFAALSFVGILSYVLAVRQNLAKEPKILQAAMFTLVAGLCFGLATMMRGNGILGGLIFAWDAIQAISQPTKLFHDPETLTMFVATLCAGVMVALGFVMPQVAAYLEYCTGGNSRPWCSKLVPSIYGWVQEHYWGVGFLRYWTLGNLPLFLLAGPVIVIMVYTGYVGLVSPRTILSTLVKNQKPAKEDVETKVFDHVMARLALQQLILALMATTSFHVQIINRISSGYPVWYIFLAIAMCGSSTEGDSGRDRKVSKMGSMTGFSLGQGGLEWVVRGMAMYALVQGGLYACFLPPA